MRRGRRGIRTKAMVNIAKERIDILFKLAEREALSHDFQRANRYVALARKIGMRYNVRIPKQYKLRFCKHCNSYLHPPVTSRIRKKTDRTVIFCKQCNRYTRIPHIREVKERRKRL
jgi:ribonuclease P protein subunit RPR2